MNEKISIQFIGAAQTVTGSKHLLKTPTMNILIDCGLFQGLKELRMKNWEPLPINVKDIQVLLLTHAHLDHCGYLPLLVKHGFRGKILMTPPTRDLAEIILRDSAKIQEEDAMQANMGGYSMHKPALPLYNEKDVETALRYFEIRQDNEWIKLSNDIQFRFQKNGHILGSAFIEMECFGKKIVFSGDIGRDNSELVGSPNILKEADYLIMESTYGNRLHEAVSPLEILAQVIQQTLHNKGNILIPSFAVGRAQELMLMINELKQKNKIPDVPVYLDSPMGAEATEILHKYPKWHNLTEQQCREVCQHIIITRDFENTLRIIADKKNKIVIAASGMLTGGRVLEYMKAWLNDKKNTILFAGYQAEGTRGRAMKEGAHEVKIHGKYYPVRCELKDITSLSAHADQGEMIRWLSRFVKKPKKIFLVHGELSAQETFKMKIYDELKLDVTIPKQYEEFQLT